jgi:hypothetical protein
LTVCGAQCVSVAFVIFCKLCPADCGFGLTHNTGYYVWGHCFGGMKYCKSSSTLAENHAKTLNPCMQGCSRMQGCACKQDCVFIASERFLLGCIPAVGRHQRSVVCQDCTRTKVHIVERCSLFLPLRWGAGPMALMLWLNLVI